MARDPYEYFRIEARELLEQLAKGAMLLERGEAAPGQVAVLLRAAHTLKGAARVVRQPEIAEIAHAIEEVLMPFRSGGEQSARSTAGVLLERVDAASALVDRLDRAGGGGVAGARPPADDRPPPPPRVGSEEIGAVIDGVAEVGAAVVKLRRISDSIRRARRIAELAAAPGGKDDSAPPDSGAFSELGGLLESAERGLDSTLEQADRDLRQVRDAADRLQLVPVALMFHVLERAVRDAALSGGKRAVFAPGPCDLRIEPDTFGTLQSALLHAVRNAVAHGIEAERVRTEQGKPPHGRVGLEIVRRGGRASFVCTDDGKGIDVDAVQRVLERRGVSREQTRGLGGEELARLLLQGGISTSAAVTEVAGRGVGLDAVRDSAARLGGEVTIRSEVGSGTAVEITIPLRASALDVLFVEVGGEGVALPLHSVRATVALRSELVVRTAGVEEMRVDGRMLRFAPLGRLLGRGAPDAASAGGGSAVVIAAREKAAAVGVDRLIGVENVLVRALPEGAPAQGIVAGVCLDSAGDPQLVLEPQGVVEETHRAVAPSGAPARSAPAILVVDDSLTTRMLEQSILESAGYRVEVATSGEQAMEKARTGGYGLFLVDVEMPGMDGFTFVERTRADPVLREVPAILVTSRASIEDRRRGRAAGAQGYVVKSEFDQRELLDRIRSLLA